VYGRLRTHLGEVFRGLAEHKVSRIEEGNLMADHVHMMIAIPPKYAVSNVVGCRPERNRAGLFQVLLPRNSRYRARRFDSLISLSYD
jgi:putative transposase